MASTPFNIIAFAVEIPLIVLALVAVLLRFWSRWATKRIFALDDTLIALGTVSPTDEAYARGCCSTVLRHGDRVVRLHGRLCRVLVRMIC